MTNEKISISIEQKEYINQAIKSYFGNITSFSNYFQLEQKELEDSINKRKISAKLLACLYDPLKMSSFDDGIVYDKIQLLKKELPNTRKEVQEFSCALGYDDTTIHTALTRMRISSKLGNDLATRLINWNPYNVDSKMTLAAKNAGKCYESEGFKSGEKRFREIAHNLDKKQLMFLNENIELFCYFDKFDWKFLLLIQGLNEGELESTEEFLENHSVVFNSWKLQQCERLKQEANNRVVETEKSKDNYIDDIIKSIETYINNNVFKYMMIYLLIQMIPYIFYLTKKDWEMLGKFSLLENWSNRKILYQNKEWTITYMRGLLYSKHI